MEPREIKEESFHGLSNIMQDYLVSDMAYADGGILPVIMMSYS